MPPKIKKKATENSRRVVIYKIIHYVHTFFEHMLIGPSFKSIFTPSTDMATISSKIFVKVRKTYWTNMRITSKINIAFETDHGKIIVKISRIEFLVDENISCVKFNMSIKFGIVIYVPFSKTNSEIIKKNRKGNFSWSLNLSSYYFIIVDKNMFKNVVLKVHK